MAAATDKPYPGMHLRALLSSRGVEITPDEAEALVVGLLRFHTLANAAASKRAGDSTPKSTPQGVLPSGSARPARPTLAEGPTVYNVGPSKYTGTAQ